MLCQCNMWLNAIIFCFLLVGCHCLKSQSLQWFEGSLVQLDSQVLVGEISLAPAYDVVLFSRRYVSLKIVDDVRSVHHLYEVVLKGKINVLRRKKLNAFSIEIESIEYDYYIHCDDELLPLRKFKKMLYKNQLEADERIRSFMAANRLTTALPEHILQIVKYYNGLFLSNEQLAKK